MAELISHNCQRIETIYQLLGEKEKRHYSSSCVDAYQMSYIFVCIHKETTRCRNRPSRDFNSLSAVWKNRWWERIHRFRNNGYYFCPAGIRRWPKEPPNYIAFRYQGKLQTIHHIEGYTVTKNMHDVIEFMPDENWNDDHYIFWVGPSHHTKQGSKNRERNISKRTCLGCHRPFADLWYNYRS